MDIDSGNLEFCKKNHIICSYKLCKGNKPSRGRKVVTSLIFFFTCLCWQFAAQLNLAHGLPSSAALRCTVAYRMEFLSVGLFCISLTACVCVCRGRFWVSITTSTTTTDAAANEVIQRLWQRDRNLLQRKVCTENAFARHYDRTSCVHYVLCTDSHCVCVCEKERECVCSQSCRCLIYVANQTFCLWLAS